MWLLGHDGEGVGGACAEPSGAAPSGCKVCSQEGAWSAHKRVHACKLGSSSRVRAQEYFMRLVDTTVETSVAHVRDFVRRYLEQRLADARARIGAYGSRYANAMLTALDTSRRGAPGPASPGRDSA